jgi:NDP-sugar pyrophosphorylase family protein
MESIVKKAMIMAAGVGSRLEPLTCSIPKPLIPIVNKPVMDILLERLHSEGIDNVIANTHYCADQIINRYSTNPFGINFNYIHEDVLSGTAGGLKKCQKFFEKGETFLVLSADGLSNVNFKELIASHIKSKAMVTMGIKQIAKEEIPKFGVVVTDEKRFVKEFQEKPSIDEAKSDLINTGIYVFNYDIFNFIPEGVFYDFAKNVFPTLLENNIKINTYNLCEYWSDIGTISQYITSSWDVYNGCVNCKNINPILQKYDFKTTSKKNIIGKNCKIEKNVVLDNCIIFDNVQICEGVVLENCVVAAGTKVENSGKDLVLAP